MSNEETVVRENRLIGIGVFILGFVLWLLFSGTIFLITYLSGIKGVLIADNMYVVWLVIVCLIGLNGVLYGLESFKKKGYTKHLLTYIFIMTAELILLGFGLAGALFIFPSIYPYNSLSVSVFLTTLFVFFLGFCSIVVIWKLDQLVRKLKIEERKIIVFAWMLIFVPTLLASGFMGLNVATQKNVLHDQAILGKEILIKEINPGVLEITLDPQDRDYFFRTFAVAVSEGKTAKIYDEGDVGRRPKTNKIYLKTTCLENGYLKQDGMPYLRFISSNGQEGIFFIKK